MLVLNCTNRKCSLLNSKFAGFYLNLKKCPSEKPEDEYLECYDYGTKENLEEQVGHK